MDMNTLSKLNHFLLMPAISFVNIYQSKLGGGDDRPDIQLPCSSSSKPHHREYCGSKTSQV
ncbi:hypothetical protein RCO48_13945 [Peribacillus frigoritolerans]|nr:hypothetical protein [Peribacillus frigoritolerans]